MRDLGRGNVDVGEHRDVPEALAVHVLLHFIELSKVVSQLRNDELCPGRDFQLQLVELHHQVGLVNLEGVHYGAGKEIEGGGVDVAWAHLIFDALAHGLNQPEKQHGIQIINGFRAAGKTLLLGVARQGQDILHPQARQGM